MIDKLRELAERAPDICDPYGDAYDIGPYRFSFLSDGTLRASTGAAMEEGRPALAWLRDALETAIVARGWFWEMKEYNGEIRARIFAHSGLEAVSERQDTPADALLSALLEAVRGAG